MTANNYFKCARRVYFFDEAVRPSIEEAFRNAQIWQLRCEHEFKVRQPICAWARPRAPGPWGDCVLIGEAP